MSLTIFIRRFASTLLLGFVVAFLPSAHASEADVKRVWQILDYLAVDYAGAVKDGKVVSESEYAEMTEFARTARTKISTLDAKPPQAELVTQATQLEAAIKAKADPADVAARAKSLGAQLLAAYPVPLSPTSIPDVQVGGKLYAANCASCHGATGNGDGPVGKALDPPPIAFTDKERARQRSVFALYQAVTQGIPGTSMPAFGQLSDQERWALAIYAGSFSHDRQQVEQGETLWSAGGKVAAEVSSVEHFVSLTEDDLGRALGASDAGAVMAYLHSQPQALSKASSSSLALARERLHESLLAYQGGDAKKAQDLALSSYLDGVEPYEQALAARDSALKDSIEVQMGRYRSLLAGAGSQDETKAAAASIEQLFINADKALAASQADSTAAFFGSLTILLREGIEALLVVIAMIAFLRKAERPDALAYVHAGWIAALAAGGVTWVAATYLVTISGANREVTEGLSSLFAAAVLLSVGVWMHQKSVAGQWQAYLRERMSAALNRKSAFFMFGLAFVAVYREVFETILFYAALWGQGNNGAILAGLAAGVACLVLVTVVMLRFSAKMPIGKFFSASSWLVAVLAVVLTGKGIAALQEAGWIAPSGLSAPRFELLGIYPSAVGLLAQAAVLALILGMFIGNGRAARVRGG